MARQEELRARSRDRKGGLNGIDGHVRASQEGFRRHVLPPTTSEFIRLALAGAAPHGIANCKNQNYPERKVATVASHR